jgi:hypothetical protein
MQLQAGDESLSNVLEDLHIKENSFIARIAAKKLRSSQVAIVIGRTIHLHNTSKEEFHSNVRWVRHEMVHLDQFRRYGKWRFVILYLLESVKKGYRNNRFEVEARAAELNESIPLHRIGTHAR